MSTGLAIFLGVILALVVGIAGGLLLGWYIWRKKKIDT